MRVRGGIAVAVALVILLARPVGAAPVTFADAAGDAGPAGLPAGSEANLDVIKATVTSIGETFVYTVELAALERSTLPNGAIFIMSFSYRGSEYGWRYYFGTTSYDGQTFFLKDADTPGFGDAMCGGCRARADAKARTVTLTASRSAISRSIRSVDATAPPLGAGSVLSDLQVETGRYVEAVVWAQADRATGGPLTYRF